MFPKLNVVLAFAVVYICGQSTSIALDGVQSPKSHLSEYDYNLQEVLKPEQHLLKPLGVAPPAFGSLLRQPKAEAEKWIPTCNNDLKDTDCKKITDENPKTFWKSKPPNDKPFQHEVIIDLRKTKNVNAVQIDPGQAAVTSGGAITEHRVFLSETKGNWGSPVAFGTWFEDETGISY
jgi:hypothetical protein